MCAEVTRKGAEALQKLLRSRGSTSLLKKAGAHRIFLNRFVQSSLSVASLSRESLDNCPVSDAALLALKRVDVDQFHFPGSRQKLC